MTKKLASLSLDLDNLWSYMKTHGDPGWQDFLGYLDVVVPRFLDMLDELSISMTVFVVGQDAVIKENKPILKSIADAGHEIANHSFNHEPWLHLYSPEEISKEIERAEEAIHSATGVAPKGFRGPGYSLSETVLDVLRQRGYDYDCSTFPTIVGPLARAYYFAKSRLSSDQKERRKVLFGGVKDGFRPLNPYAWDLNGERMVEIPVSTMPFSRIPIHYSYLHWIAGASDGLASAYYTSALRVCDVAGVTPSLLLHPLDFMGGDDVQQLAFFPGMNQSSAEKLARMKRFLCKLSDEYDVTTMAGHANTLNLPELPLRKPDFAVEDADAVDFAQETSATR